jgi:AraC-like DNA-binding protein
MNTPALDRLIGSAASIPDPESYFRGLSSEQFEIPKNLIIFLRKQTREIRKEMHFHHRFVLIVNLETSGKVVVDSRIFQFEPGKALLIFPHQFHHYLDIASSSVTWLFITFEIYDSSPLEPLRNILLDVTDSCFLYLKDLIDNYVDSDATRKKSRIQIFLMTGIILNELIKTCTKGTTRKTIPKSTLIDRVNGYIWNNIEKKIKLEDVAAHFSLSESHLRYLFRKKMGISIGIYIKQLRINRARSFLLSSNLNISEIAYRCGYDSLYTFSRAFRKSTGQSPLSYKKSMGHFTPAAHNLPSETD